MTIMARVRWFVLVVVAMSLWPGWARAQEDEEEGPAYEHYVTIGVGFMGVLGGNFMTKPDSQEVTMGGAEGIPEGAPEYPGFAGVHAGIGVTFDLRIMEYFGLELDVYWSKDSGSADITYEFEPPPPEPKQRHEFVIEISQNAIHLPLLFKGILPGEIVQPQIFVGPEFVVPYDAEFAVTEGKNAYPNLQAEDAFRATAKAYTLVTFGIGVEFKLPLPVVDLRIPVMIRAGINPSLEDTREARETLHGPDLNTVQAVEYHGIYQYQAAGSLGAAVHF